MVHLYSRIVEDEIKMKSGVDKNSPWANADKQGYLYTQIGKRKNWSNRWCVLKDACLYYFKRKTDPRPAGVVPLEELRTLYNSLSLSLSLSISLDTTHNTTLTQHTTHNTQHTTHNTQHTTHTYTY